MSDLRLSRLVQRLPVNDRDIQRERNDSLFCHQGTVKQRVSRILLEYGAH